MSDEFHHAPVLLLARNFSQKLSFGAQTFPVSSQPKGELLRKLERNWFRNFGVIHTGKEMILLPLSNEIEEVLGAEGSGTSTKKRMNLKSL